MSTEAALNRNAELADLYRNKWKQLYDITRRSQKNLAPISTPYLVSVNSAYEEADVRLVVVGKETNGWLSHDEVAGLAAEPAVERLMKHYADFNLGTKYSGKASFWTPAKSLYDQLNPNGPAMGFVGLNASKMCQDQRQPDDQVRDEIIATGLLSAEIRILKPHVIVFHTGPGYEGWLDGWFRGLNRTGDKWLARLAAEGLPKHTFRSYHPAYLRRKKKLSEIQQRIKSEVANAN